MESLGPVESWPATARTVCDLDTCRHWYALLMHLGYWSNRAYQTSRLLVFVVIGAESTLEAHTVDSNASLSVLGQIAVWLPSFFTSFTATALIAYKNWYVWFFIVSAMQNICSRIDLQDSSVVDHKVCGSKQGWLADRSNTGLDHWVRCWILSNMGQFHHPRIIVISSHWVSIHKPCNMILYLDCVYMQPSSHHRNLLYDCMRLFHTGHAGCTCSSLSTFFQAISLFSILISEYTTRKGVIPNRHRCSGFCQDDSLGHDIWAGFSNTGYGVCSRAEFHEYILHPVECCTISSYKPNII